MNRMLSVPEDRRRDDPESAPILTWWAGIYDHVFVALHPFINAPEDFEDEDLDWYRHTFASETHRWRDVANALDNRDFAEFALATLCAGYGMASKNRKMAPFPDDRLIQQLQDYADGEDLSFPWDDSISPALSPSLAELFGGTNSDEIICWSEFRETSCIMTVDRLKAPDWTASLNHGVYALQDANNGILVTSSFDHIWSLVALTKGARAHVKPEWIFEGFWVGPETTGEWINEPGTYVPPKGWPA